MMVRCPICNKQPVNVQAWSFLDTTVNVPTCVLCQERTHVMSMGLRTSGLLATKWDDREKVWVWQ